MSLSKINSNSIQDGIIEVADVADNAITTAKIADANVTVDKIATDAITTAKIADGNVTVDKIATDAITTAKIADGNVTVAKLESTLDLTGKTVSLNSPTISGNTAFDTDTLYINASDNRVGIGTASPSAKLSISGTTGTGGIYIEDSSTNDYSPAIVNIGKRLDNNSAQAFTGRLALAKNRTDAAVGSSTKLGTIYFGGNHTDGTMANVAYSASISAASEGTFNSSSDMPTGLTFYTGSTGIALDSLSTAGTEKMRIDSSGNVGIGTSSPDYKLHIDSGSGSNALKLDSNSGGATNLVFRKDNLRDATHVEYTFQHKSDNTDFIIYGYDGSTFKNIINYDWSTSATMLYAGNSEAMRIDSSGNILFNTTDTSVFNNTSGNGICYRNNASFDIATSGDNCLILNRMTTTGTLSELRYAGVIRGSISTNGSTISYNTSSDYRLKENVTPMTGALTRIAALKPVTFTWKDTELDGEGFLAHELQEVIPEAVTGTKDAVDKDGNPEYQGVDTSHMVATLVKAIQEQQEQIEALKTEVAALKA